MVSRRLPADAVPNAVARALDAHRAAGTPFVDLTASNPTAAGIPYPASLVASLAAPEGLRYDPQPFGLLEARMAVAADQRRRGVEVDPEHVVLTASTSEGYGWLFKLLCDPGEAVLVPQPSYPLFEHLTRLEGIRAEPYALEYQGQWTIDFHAVADAPRDVRAVLVVSPNNPTGSYVSHDEFARLSAVCRERQWALVVDEVFADYPLDAVRPLTDLAARADVLSFTLAGLSKTVGLPQLKLAWCIAGGPPAARAAALGGLEVIADSYLSVATPVQLAAARLLEEGAAIRHAIHQRTRRNLHVLRAAAARHPACEVLRAEGGWSAVLRVPATHGEERLTLELLEAGVLVHPGYFFDFPREAYLVLSLLPPPASFDDGIARLFGRIDS